ncbi:MAG: ferredoxin [Acidimicrobiaceae bacterium]|nr:ferredoxin [Acidimicrobiaceae bacterium]
MHPGAGAPGGHRHRCRRGPEHSDPVAGRGGIVSADLVRVAVDSERCIGGGQCEMLEPEVFLVDDDEAISSVIGSGELPRDRADVVVHRCPGAAISIVEPQRPSE